MSPIIPFLIALAPLVRLSTACDCYRTDAGDLFTDYKLIDFRNGGASDLATSFLTLVHFPYYESNHMVSENIIPHPGHLQLLTRNDGSQTSGEINLKEEVRYGSFRSSFQVTGDAGGVAGFFLYKDVGANEQDIENLTSEARNQIHYTTHTPQGDDPTLEIENPTINTTIPADWSEFNTHRFDWVPGLSTFSVNNGPNQKLTEGVPTVPSTFVLNMWSTGEKWWGGSMAAGGSASMNIQWVEAVYNKSDESTTEVVTCQTVCDV